MSGKKIVLLFPGQGAQYPGMGKRLCETYPEAREIFSRADAVLGSDFSRLVFEGPSEELTLTKNSQPAIYVASYAVYAVFSRLYPDVVPYACAGLSLGEYTALAASGKISFEEGLRLVARRGALMQEACENRPGSMRVVLGSDEAKVFEILRSLGENAEVWIANLNCPGQIVIAGTDRDLQKAEIALKEAGIKRVLPLEVSGAFHTPLMQTAQEGLTPFLLHCPLRETKVRFLMNTPGGFVEDLEEIRQNLIRQVVEPVRWQSIIESVSSAGATLFLEMGPGKTLQGMNKRIGVTVPTYGADTEEDVQKLGENREFIHGIT